MDDGGCQLNIPEMSYREALEGAAVDAGYLYDRAAEIVADKFPDVGFRDGSVMISALVNSASMLFYSYIANEHLHGIDGNLADIALEQTAESFLQENGCRWRS